MRTIMPLNHKGGVGKTTTALALAEGLALRGFRTVLLDLDPQCNTTKYARAKSDGEVTVYDLVTTSNYSLQEALQSYSYGRIVPGDILLMDAEVDIMKLMSPLTMLADVIDEYKKHDDCDFLVIDPPPSLNAVTKNGLVAADDLIVLVNPDKQAIDGVGRIIATAHAVQSNKRLNPSLGITGFLITQYDQQKSLSRELVEQLPKLAGEFGLEVHESRIRTCEGVRRAMSKGVSIYDRKALNRMGIDASRGASDYNAFIDEYLDLVSRR